MGDAMGIIVCQCVYVTVKAVTDHIINTQIHTSCCRLSVFQSRDVTCGRQWTSQFVFI